MEDENVDFIDAEARTSNKDEKLSFRMIVLEYVRKIGSLASVEWRGGFWETRPHPNPSLNITLKTYVTDSREAYSNAVDYLYDILYPHFDKKMLDVAEKLEKELDDLYKDKTIVKEKDREDSTDEESQIGERKFADTADKLSFRSGRVRICRKMFRAICCFLKRVDYLKGGSIDEVM